MALSKNAIKYLNALNLKKFRTAQQEFVVAGDKIVGELLVQSRLSLRRVYATVAWLDAHRNLVPPGVLVEEVSWEELKKVAGQKTPTGVLAVVAIPRYDLVEHRPIAGQLALFLAGLQDPGNVGTILRVADWFGLGPVICSPDTVDVFNPKVVQASMGAFLRVPTPIATLAEIRAIQEDLPIYGAVLGGANLYTTAFAPTGGLLVIGNESRGIAATDQGLLTQAISIPAGPSAGAESLNAAVATGIICAYWRQQFPE